MHGKSDSTARGGRTATKEQLRVTHATHDGQDDDRSRIQKLIKEVCLLRIHAFVYLNVLFR